MAAKAVLGISPGTRRCGIAIAHSRKLIHYQVQTFPGTWSHKKLIRILRVIAGHIKLHAIEEIAVKLPDALPTSKAFIQLIGSINVLRERNGITIQYYTLNELKLGHAGTGKISRVRLIESIVKRHPELLPEYQRERRNKEAYYYKMFEAVLCTQMEHLNK